MGVLVRRPWLLTFLTLTGGLALLAALAHTPPVKSRLLTYLTGALARYDIIAEADSLDYNLATLTFEIRGLRLAAGEHSGEPFIEADLVVIDLPWSAAWSQFSLESVALNGVRMTVVRGRDGSTNLPSSQSPTTTPQPVSLRIARLDLSDLQMRWTDAGSAVHVFVDDVEGSFRPEADATTGTLRFNRPIRLQARDRETSLRVEDARLAFDGRNVTVDRLSVQAPEGRLEVHGRVPSILGNPELVLDYQGSVDVARVAYWLDHRGWSGVVRAAGQITGSAGDPSISARIDSRELLVAGLGPVDLRASVTAGRSGMTIDGFDTSVAGGRIAGTFRMTLDAAAGRGSGDAHLKWDDLDPNAFLRIWRATEGLTLASRCSGNLELAWRRPALRALTGSLRNESIRASGVGVPLTGVTILRAREGRWTLAADHEVDGDVRWTADGLLGLEEDFARSRLAGSFRIETARPDRLVRLVAAVTGRDRGDSWPLKGHVRTDGTLDGTLGMPRVAFMVQGARLAYGSAPPAQLDVRGVFTPEQFALSSFRAASAGMVVDSRGAIDLRTGRLNASLHTSVGDLSVAAGLLPGWAAPRGSLTADVLVSGTTRRPSASAALTGTALQIAGQPASRLSATMRFVDRILTVEKLELSQVEGGVGGTGSYDFGTGKYRARIEGQGLAWHPMTSGGAAATDTPAAQQLAVEFDGEGSLDDPRGQGRIEIGALSWRGMEYGPVDTAFTLANRQLVADITATRLHTRLHGTLALAGADALDRFELQARIVDGPIAELSRLRGLEPATPLSGSLTLTASAAGTIRDLPVIKLDTRFESLNIRIGDTAVQLRQPASATYTGTTLHVEQLELAIDGSILTIDGTLGPGESGLSAALSARLEDLRDLLVFAVPATGGITFDGAAIFSARASGRPDRPQVEARLLVSDGSVASGSLPPLTVSALRLAVADGVIALEELRAAWQGADLTGSGTLPARLLAEHLPEAYVATLPPQAQPFRVTAAVGSLTPAVLQGWAPPELVNRVAGKIAGELTLEGDALSVEHTRGVLTLSEGMLELAGVTVAQQRPTRMTLDRNRLRITEWNWSGPTTELALIGGLTLGDQLGLELDVLGQLDLRLLGVVLPEIATAGRANLGIQLRGRLSDPRVDGAIAIQDAELRMADPRLAVTSVDGDLVLEQDRLVLRAIEGLANGGTLSASGQLRFAGLQPSDGSVSLIARSVGLEYPVGLRSEIDADITVGAAAGELELSGSAIVLRGQYRESITLAGGLLAALRQQQTAVASGAQSVLDRLRLNIRLQSRDDIVVDNNLARLQLAGDLRLVGTLARPSLLGRAAIAEGGLVFLGGNTYQVVTGTVDFTNPAQIEPELALDARTRVSGNEIILSVTGIPGSLETDLRSDNPLLTESDIVSLLVTGRTTAEMGGATADIAREQALGLVGGELLGVAGRALGLDVVRVERGFSNEVVRFDPALVATETDPGARLTFSKQVARQVLLVFSQSLRNSGSFTWIVTYSPRPNLEVRGVVRDDTDRSYEFRHSVSFGRLERSIDPRKARESPDRVAAIRLEGVLGFPERDLTRRLKLQPGDRFDFYTWQDDRERLLGSYHDHGYREARVRTTRTSDAEGLVTLHYVIDRGPITTIDVSGYELPSRIKRELETAWTRSIVDSFLLDDIIGRVKLHMVGEGHVAAAVTADLVTPDPGAKKVAVKIEPGKRFARRRIEFTGNSLLSDDELRQTLERAALEHIAWIDSSRARLAIVSRYAANGFLNAVVTVGQPEFRAETAILPVLIEEGPVFRLSAVAFEGVAATRRSVIAEAAGFRDGDPFSEPRLEAARLRIEREYRRAGFNEVDVKSRSEIHRESARVAVTFAVTEGRRHVLREVRVAGALRTNPRLVARALRLEVGEPVDLVDWYRARKRLYDTGVFRSVEIASEPVEAAAAPGEQPTRARVVLQEWPAWQLRYGLQLNDERAPAEDLSRRMSLGLAGDLANRNFFGRAMSVGVSARWADRFRAGRAFATAPTFGGLPVLSSVFFARSREEIGEESASAFLTDKNTLTLEQRFRPSADIQVSYGYSFERNHTFELDARPGDPFAFDITVDIARLSAQTTLDTRDDLVDATRGWFHSSSVEYAAERLGSDLRFAKYLAQQFYYRRLGRGFVMASAARLGLSTAFGQDLIPSERFFAGGGNSVRGYLEDSLGPRNIFGDSIGGNALLVLNQEVRFPLGWRLRGVGFIDAGNAFAQIEDLSFRDMRIGFGAGLRIDTPFVLLRIDYGRRVRRSSTEPTGRFFFSIGQTF